MREFIRLHITAEGYKSGTKSYACIELNGGCASVSPNRAGASDPGA